MVWDAMLWYAMVWYAMVCYGMLWYAMVCYGMEYIKYVLICPLSATYMYRGGNSVSAFPESHSPRSQTREHPHQEVGQEQSKLACRDNTLSRACHDVIRAHVCL